MPTIAMRLYRRLARAFPHEFQIVYGTDVIQLGEDVVDDVYRQHGLFGLLRLIADIAVRVPMEYLSEMRRDLVYAVRALIKSPGFAAVGIVSLGLGIGVSATAVSQIYGFILRDVPGAQEPDRLQMLQGVSYPYFEHYRDQHNLFVGVAAFDNAVPFNVAVSGSSANVKTERVFGQIVSPEYFSVMGVSAERGRLFSPDIDKPGAAPVVFISDRFWRDRLDSDPGAVGRTVHLNGQTATIVGIGPKDFLGVLPIVSADLFVPTTSPASMAPELSGDIIHKRDVKAFGVLMRLAPGVTAKSAEAALDAITRHLDEETLDPARNAKGRRVVLLPGGKIVPIPKDQLPVILGFQVVLNGLILSVACMNLANMLLARAAARRREVAIRLAVGASRFRLIRQLLTESVLLSLSGGAAGLVFAYWLTHLASKMKLPTPVPVKFDFSPDWHTLVFTSILSVATGILFGLAPALASTRADLASTLKQGALAQLRGYRRFGTRNLLMVFQVAGSLTLLLIAGFMVIGLNNTSSIHVAFDSNTMYLLSLDPVRDGYSADQASTLFDNLPDRLKHAAGIRDVALAEAAPFSIVAGGSTLSATSRTGPDQVVRGVAKQIIGANYFSALSETILSGREFDTRDQRFEPSTGKALPVVLNETAARAFFGNDDPLGRRISETAKSYEVVGVIRDLSTGMTQNGPVPIVYLPLTKSDFSHPPPGGMIVMVRANSGGATGAGAMDGVRREMAGIDPNLVAFNVRTLAEQIDQATSFLRTSSIIYGGIGVFGLVLASIGLAGVTAYSVARRRKEIGIRMALGARKGQVLRLVLREGAVMVTVGSVLGLLAAFGISKAVSALTSIYVQVFKVGTSDPRLVFGAPLLLAALAMLACYLPARKSTQIDPLKALREE
jgi:macrolide transport system ATP-binding/permease protein